MGFLRFGFVSYYLSDQLVGGFTAGAAVFVFTSEIDVLFGLELDKHGGPGNLFSVCNFFHQQKHNKSLCFCYYSDVL